MLGNYAARVRFRLFPQPVNGLGWAATGAAVISAMILPWFVRRRPAALSSAYNGASLGGVIFSPLWAALIGALGFAYATAIVGFAMVVVLWWLSGRYFAHAPAAMRLLPDGDAPIIQVPSHAGASMPPLPGTVLW